MGSVRSSTEQEHRPARAASGSRARSPAGSGPDPSPRRRASTPPRRRAAPMRRRASDGGRAAGALQLDQERLRRQAAARPLATSTMSSATSSRYDQSIVSCRIPAAGYGTTGISPCRPLPSRVALPQARIGHLPGVVDVDAPNRGLDEVRGDEHDLGPAVAIERDALRRLVDVRRRLREDLLLPLAAREQHDRRGDRSCDETDCQEPGHTSAEARRREPLPHGRLLVGLSLGIIGDTCGTQDVTTQCAFDPLPTFFAPR